VRLAQILEHEVPGFGFLIPRGVEAARHETRRHQWRHLVIEGDFLAAGGVQVARTAGQPGLEYHKARRCVIVGLVGQAEPQDAR